MLRRSHILTTAAFLAICATPASAATWEQLHDTSPPPSSIAASAADEYQDLRSPDARDAAEHRGPYATGDEPKQDLRSPDARDAALDLPRVHYPTPTVATEPPAPIVTVIESPVGGFDWGDAGIGAAGMVALFSVAAGSSLLLMGRRRRRDVRVATH